MAKVVNTIEKDVFNVPTYVRMTLVPQTQSVDFVDIRNFDGEMQTGVLNIQ